jgi:RNA polymerase sigma-70 factor (ECF subfamily)
MLIEQEITTLLRRHQDGDPNAVEQLLPLVYSELHRIAGSQLRKERKEHTLQATALINEAWMRLNQASPEFQSRAHFLGIAAQAMRQILVDHARRRNAGKRDGGIRVQLSHAIPTTDEPDDALLALDGALKNLEKKDPNKARMIEMRFFGGFTAEETAAALGMSVDAVRGQLRMAQAWLRREMSKELSDTRL